MRSGAGVAKCVQREKERTGRALGTLAGGYSQAGELRPRGGDARAGDGSLTASAPVSFSSRCE